MHMKATASLLVLMGVATGCGMFGKKSKDEAPQTITEPKPVPGGELKYDLSAQTFASCAVLGGEIEEQIKIRDANDKAMNAYYEAQTAKSVSPDTGSAVGSSPEISGAGPTSSARNASAPGAAAPQASTAADSASSGDVGTNIQEAGVDEFDMAKLGAHHILLQSGQKVNVVDRASLTSLGSITVSGYNSKLVVAGDTLVVLSQIAEAVGGYPGEPRPLPAEAGSAAMLTSQVAGPDIGRPFIPRTVKVNASFYSLVPGKLPTKTGEQNFKGDLVDARVVNNALVLAVRSNLRSGHHPIPVPGQGGAQRPPHFVDKNAELVEEVRCDSIHKPVLRDTDFSLTKVFSVSVKDAGANIQSVSVFGSGDRLYMTDRAVYLTKERPQWVPWTMPAQGNRDAPVSSGELESERVVVSKIAFDAANGALRYEAIGAVPGHVKDVWAFKELSDGKSLAVATTLGQRWGRGGGTERNQLTVLQPQDRKLVEVGAIKDFAKNENIRAVRYVGNTAYVVTFRQTDPLFAFDLTDPASPKTLGELKIPGFSTYLHPVGDGLLFGFGHDADLSGRVTGLQASLFDVADPSKLSRIDAKTFRGFSYQSELLHNHHAFFYSPDDDLLAFPVSLNSDQPACMSPRPGEKLVCEGPNLSFSGMIFYQVSRSGLSEVARVSHAALVPPACRSSSHHLNVNRVFKADGRFLGLSEWGVTAHGGGSLAQQASVVFKENACSQ